MNQRTNGFTIIELMLAMSFVAMLLLAIAMTTIQISRTYTRGITLREVNQAARSVSDDISRTFSGSLYKGGNFVSDDDGGRLCLGSYTYVWNTGDAVKKGASNANLYKYNSGDEFVHFARVSDAGSQLCISGAPRTIDRDKATELLGDGERELFMHSFDVVQGAMDATGEQGLYAVSMVIGTNSGGELLETGSGTCRPPSDLESMQDYCSVNKFDTIVRVGNSGQGE